MNTYKNDRGEGVFFQLRSAYHRSPMRAQSLFFIAVPLFLIAWVVWTFAHAPWTPLLIVSLILSVGGLLLVTIARITLGSSFSITPQARKLVTTGLYSRIRNPVYVFSAIAIVGIILLVGRPLWLLILIPLIVIQVMRAHAESRVLEERFGDEYRRYKAQTWF